MEALPEGVKGEFRMGFQIEDLRFQIGRDISARAALQSAI